MKRVILIVLDSVGCGAAKVAAEYGDEGSNTLLAVSKSSHFAMPHMKQMGYFNIDGGISSLYEKHPTGAFARLCEKSKGKDTTTGHWEISGVTSKTPMPTYPNGFPDDVISDFEKACGRKTLCNRPYSGTEVIKDYGEEHMKTGDLIVYTSADSVFQIAAHVDMVPVETLYSYCEIARKILTGKNGVGRVIARPFSGEPGNFKRTNQRHDFSLEPTGITMLDILKKENYDSFAIGKIVDIFAGRGVTDYIRTQDNSDGINKTIEWMNRDFGGLLFVNLVDTDMIYGHRNDVDGYANALSAFDARLPEIMAHLQKDDILMITADHGCDPSTPSTDHSREDVPLLLYGSPVVSGKNYGTIDGFDCISASILSYLGTSQRTPGKDLFSIS